MKFKVNTILKEKLIKLYQNRGEESQSLNLYSLYSGALRTLSVAVERILVGIYAFKIFRGDNAVAN